MRKLTKELSKRRRISVLNAALGCLKLNLFETFVFIYMMLHYGLLATQLVPIDMNHVVQNVSKLSLVTTNTVVSLVC